VSAVKIGKRSLGADTVQGVFTYVALYLLIFAFGSVIMTLFTDDLVTASSATIASLGNVGPALGDLGAVESYGDLSSGAKLFLSLLMVVGRLEVFALLVLFVPAFWRR
jgi:trk system potassium uptake protein TrkH